MRFAIGMGLILLVLGTATIGYMLMDHGMSADHARCVTADITGSGSCFQGNVLPDSVVTAFAVSFLLLVLGTFAIGENSSPERRAAERFRQFFQFRAIESHRVFGLSRIESVFCLKL